MPAVLRAPAPLVAQQWKRAWDVGRIVGKLAVTSSAASFAYLAYNEPSAGSLRFCLFVAAATTLGVIIPYTVLTSYPFNEAINYQLEGPNTAGKKGDSRIDLKKLVAEWGGVDLNRAWLVFLGTLTGLVGVLA